MRHDLDPRARDAEDVDHVVRGVARDRDHHVGPQHRTRHHKTCAQRLATWEPSGVAIDGEIVDGDHRWAANIAQRKYSGRSEVSIGFELPDAGRPLKVTADEPRAR